MQQVCYSELRCVSFEALDTDARINLYRIVQEALTNVARHAHAEWVEVMLIAENGRYELDIADNGRGYDPARIHQGMGLAGIRERCQALKGELNLVTASDAGVRMQIVFSGGS